METLNPRRTPPSACALQSYNASDRSGSVGPKWIAEDPKLIAVGAKLPEGDGKVVNELPARQKGPRVMTRLLMRRWATTPKGIVLPALAAPELRRNQASPVGAKGMSVGPKWVPVGAKRPQGDGEVVNAALGHHAKGLCFTSPGGT